MLSYTATQGNKNYTKVLKCTLLKIPFMTEKWQKVYAV